MNKLSQIRLFVGLIIGILVIGTIFLIFTSADTTIQKKAILSTNSNLNNFAYTKGWQVISKTGEEARLTFWKLGNDKKIELGWIPPNNSCVGWTDKYLYDQNNNQILDDKNKPIALKCETAKCSGYNCYHISLTTAQAVNIDDYIKLGNQSFVITYKNESRVVFNFGYGEIGFTLLKNNQIVADELFVYWSDDKYKFGANDSENDGLRNYTYVINSTEEMILQTKSYYAGENYEFYNETRMNETCINETILTSNYIMNKTCIIENVSYLSFIPNETCRNEETIYPEYISNQSCSNKINEFNETYNFCNDTSYFVNKTRIDRICNDTSYYVSKIKQVENCKDNSYYINGSQTQRKCSFVDYQVSLNYSTPIIYTYPLIYNYIENSNKEYRFYYDFKDICTKSYSNCNFKLSSDKKSVILNFVSDKNIDPTISYNFNATYQAINTFAKQCRSASDQIPTNSLSLQCDEGFADITSSSALDSIDTVYNTTDGGWSGYKRWQMFSFNLSGLSNINSINQTWVGHVDSISPNRYIYVWNATSSNWQIISTNRITVADITISNYTTSISDFVNSSGYYNFVVYYNGSTSGFDIYTDFVKLEVDYTEPINTNVTNCQTLDLPNTYYNLTQNIANDTATGDCIIFASQNITFDCNGYSINSAMNVTGVYTDQYNSTIKNCNITMGSGSDDTTTAMGIELESGADYCTIFNNKVTSNISSAIYVGSANYNNFTNNYVKSVMNNGIYLFFNSTNNIFINNTVYSTGYRGFTLQNLCNNNTFIGNNATGADVGISITNSTYNNLYNNTIKSTTHIGLYLITRADNTFVQGNNISGAKGGYGAVTAEGVSNNYFYNNKMTGTTSCAGILVFNTKGTNNTLGNNYASSPGGNYGIYISGIWNTTLINNVGTSVSSQGILLYIGSHQTYMLNNTGISTSGIGIYIRNSSYGTFIDNNGTSYSSYGIFLYQNASNNVLINNTGFSNASAGILVQTVSNNNTLTNNYAYGRFWSFGGIALDNVFNNTLINNTGVTNDSSGIMVTSTSEHNVLIGNNGTANTGTGIRVDGTYNNITANYGFSSSNAGIYVLGYNNSFINNTAKSTSGVGAYIRISARSNLFDNNTMISSSSIGMYVHAQANDNILTNNIVTGNLVGYGACTVENAINNTLINNTCTATTGYGIYLYSVAINNTLIGNKGISTSGAGIAIRSNSSFNNLTNNLGYSDTDVGIYSFRSSDNIFDTNNGTSNSHIGIYIFNNSNRNTLKNNIAKGNLVNYGSLTVEEHSDSNILINNTATATSDGYGIYVYSTSDNNLYNNTGASSTSNPIFISGGTNNYFSVVDTICGSADCIYINSQNTTIDCNSHSIYSAYNISGVYSNQKNTTIKNCNISVGGTLGTNASAIGIEFASGANNGLIFNNTARADVGSGISISSVSNNNLTSNTGISVSGNGIYLYSSSNNNLISNNGTSNSNYGIYLLSTSNNNVLTNNLGTSNSGSGIYVATSNNNSLSNNNGSSVSGYGIYLVVTVNSTLTSNYGFSNNSHGIILAGAGTIYNSLINNTGLTNATSGLIGGISLGSGSNYNDLTNNTATGNKVYGIYLSSANYNNLTSNTGISDIGSGIYLTSSSNNNLIGNTATSVSSYALYISASLNNNLTSNTGVSNTSLGIILGSGSNYNTLSGNNGTGYYGSGAYGIVVSLSRYNNLSNNYGTSVSGRGMYISAAINNTLINNTCRSLSNYGIYLNTADFNNFIDNYVYSNSSTAFYIETLSHDNQITNNTIISNKSVALWVHGGNGGTTPNHTIVGNIIKAYDLGIKISNQVNFNISRNDIFSDTSYALYILNSANSTTSDNNITSNTSVALFLDYRSYSSDYLSYNNNFYRNRYIGLSTGSRGIYVFGASNNSFYDCTNVSGVLTDVTVINSDTTWALNNTFINCSYNISKETGGVNNSLVRKWYYKAFVNDTDGNKLSGATVTALNSSGGQEFSILTNGTGYTDMVAITDYVSNGTRYYYSPYTLTATDATTGSTDSHTFNASLGNNLTQRFTIELITIPPVVVTEKGGFPVFFNNSNKSSPYNYTLLNATVQYTNMSEFPYNCKYADLNYVWYLKIPPININYIKSCDFIQFLKAFFNISLYTTGLRIDGLKLWFFVTLVAILIFTILLVCVYMIIRNMNKKKLVIPA